MTSNRGIPCRLTLLSNWSQETHLLGVDVTASKMSLSRASFSCCDVDGLKISDVAQKSATFCRLLALWGRLTWFFQQVSSIDPSQPTPLWTASQTADQDDNVRRIARCVVSVMGVFFKDELKNLLLEKKGKIVETKKFRKRIGLALGATETESTIDTALKCFLWQVGAALIWHFDALILPLRISGAPRSAPSGALPPVVVPVAAWDDLLKRHPGKRKMILVDGVTELWNPSRLELLEGVIAYASERQIPLWIFDESAELVSISDVPKSQERSFRGGISRRLDQKRQKPAVEWLSGQSLSRLGELTSWEKTRSNTSGIPEIV